MWEGESAGTLRQANDGVSWEFAGVDGVAVQETKFMMGC